MSEFCTGVRILLQRMETHPEEFYKEPDPNRLPNAAKWEHLMGRVMSIKRGEDVRGDAVFLTNDELDALYEGYVKIRRKAFDDYVMRRVLDADDKDEEVTITTTHQVLNVNTVNQSIYQRQQAALAQQAALTQQALAQIGNNYPYGNGQI